jgi:hypothetical protein
MNSGDVDLSPYITKNCADKRYSLCGHRHSNYAPVAHYHDDRYSLCGHSHNNYASKVCIWNNYAPISHDHCNYACVCHHHCNYYDSCTLRCLPTRLKRLENIVKVLDTYLSSLHIGIFGKFNIPGYEYPFCQCYYVACRPYSINGVTELERNGLNHWSESELPVAIHENTVISE